MYDIDKLYLTGRIFNSGGSMYSVFNKNKTELIQYKNIRSTGIRAIILNEGDELIWQEI